MAGILRGRGAALAALVLVAAALPARAWEARSGAVCEIVHSAAAGDVRVVYDPATRLYGITVTRPAPWPDAPAFAIRFGTTGLVITTDRHVLGEGGRALSVTDTGFGNVLRGLETAGSATAYSGDATAEFDLAGAPEAVAAFRACTDAPAA